MGGFGVGFAVGRGTIGLVPELMLLSMVNSTVAEDNAIKSTL